MLAAAVIIASFLGSFTGARARLTEKWIAAAELAAARMVNRHATTCPAVERKDP